MKTYEQAINIISEVAQKFKNNFQNTDLVLIENSPGRISAENVYIKDPQPSFDNSAMDGFALRSEWTSEASQENPIEYEIIGTLAAGSVEDQSYKDPCCYEIMTGAKMPSGFDCVLRVEEAKVIHKNEKRFLVISKNIKKWDQVRREGEDFSLNDQLLSVGEVVSSAHVLALASQGVSSLRVKAPLRIGLISTGSEIVPHGETPKESMIRNSTMPYLVSKLKSSNLKLEVLGSVVDSPETLKRLLQSKIKEFDILITTGAVSVGCFDIVPPVLAELGAIQHFHKVAMRPGKPLLFAEFEKGPLVFGFPGNPLSTAVAARFFLEPLLRFLFGIKSEAYYEVPLFDDVKKPEDLCCFWKAKIENSTDGISQIKALKGQESFRVKPFVEADHWVLLPEGKGLYKSGEPVRVYPIDSGF